MAFVRNPLKTNSNVFLLHIGTFESRVIPMFGAYNIHQFTIQVSNMQTQKLKMNVPYIDSTCCEEQHLTVKMLYL